VFNQILCIRCLIWWMLWRILKLLHYNRAVHKGHPYKMAKNWPLPSVWKMSTLAQPLPLFSVQAHHKFWKTQVFCTKKCGRLQLKNPSLSAKFQHWTNTLLHDCGHPLWTVPYTFPPMLQRSLVFCAFPLCFGPFGCVWHKNKLIKNVWRVISIIQENPGGHSPLLPTPMGSAHFRPLSLPPTLDLPLVYSLLEVIYSYNMVKECL